MKSVFISVLLFFVSATAYSHGGRLDSNGGHNNRKTGGYHCHREPCLSQHRKSQAALNEAKRENRAFTRLYNREDWPHWADYDGDCQDARAEALIKASTVPVTFKRSRSCTVVGGRWFDPYTGQTFQQASKLDVDHIVPLKEAHISGGHAWSKAKRREFANDPQNLLVVRDIENQSKGAKDPAKWMPDRSAYHCEYIVQWVNVKRRYDLTFDANEQQAIDDILATYGTDTNRLTCP